MAVHILEMPGLRKFPGEIIVGIKTFIKVGRKIDIASYLKDQILKFLKTKLKFFT